MVVIHLKQSDADQFLFETSIADSNDALIRQLAAIHNTRMRIMRLCMACEQLARHGPMKPEAERGIDHIREESGEAIDKGPYYSPDPIGERTGNACSPDTAEVIMKTIADAKASVSKDLVARKVATTMAMLQEKIDNIRGAVMIAYPMGLPEFDVVRAMVEDREELVGQASLDYLDPDTVTLWWAGKEFFRDQTVGDRVGRNEKTKVVCRLQGKGSGPPAREPAVSEEDRRAMMAHYFKRQEELKKVAENDDDAFMHSTWANPRGLKQSLLGTSGVAFRPGRR